MSQPCAYCARAGTSCCSGYQIILTSGDISRISNIVGNQDFWVSELPVPEDIEPGYDPLWLPLILGGESRVRVLKRSAEKKCFFLTPEGCRLPFVSRPLICRLYPYTYTSDGILGIDSACPISRDQGWQVILDQLDMPADRAREWLTLLYDEVSRH